MDSSIKRELLARLERDALHLCARFGLRYRVLEAERANVKRRYGVCFSDGTIRIRLRHATTGRALKYSSLVNTLCHELAHLQHFNHGPRFQALYARILACARRDGIYRPKQGEAWAGSAPPRAMIARPSRPEPGVRVLVDPRGVPVVRPRVGAVQLDLFGSAGYSGSAEAMRRPTGADRSGRSA
ncbi:MAG: M48 family metallopeptidase [Myxococcota bacterium]